MKLIAGEVLYFSHLPRLNLCLCAHWNDTWLAVGMAAFGIPLGVAFGASLGNMAFLAIGIPVGMAIGIAVGTGMDKKAFEEGRQIDLEITLNPKI